MPNTDDAHLHSGNPPDYTQEYLETYVYATSDTKASLSHYCDKAMKLLWVRGRRGTGSSITLTAKNGADSVTTTAATLTATDTWYAVTLDDDLTTFDAGDTLDIIVGGGSGGDLITEVCWRPLLGK